MRHTGSLWHKSIKVTLGVFLALVLIGVVLAGCGGKEETTPTLTPTPTPLVTTTSTSTPTPVVTMTVTPTPTAKPSTATPTPTVSTEPVKIGAIAAYSGPGGMGGALGDQALKLVEQDIKDMGGILGGRPVKFIKYDNRTNVAETSAGWTKLVLEERVSAVAWGGAGAAECNASADSSNQYKVPYFTFSPYPSDLTKFPYVFRAGSVATVEKEKLIGDFILNDLQPKPQKIALLGEQQTDYRETISDIKKQLEAAGMKVVYEDYINVDIVDLSPQLTAIKYAKPDTLLIHLSPTASYLTLFKQIQELGGWGDIRVLSISPASSGAGVTKLPAAEGTYHWMLWLAGSTFPAAQKFEQDYKKIVGSDPLPASVIMYLCPIVAARAINFAGTDDPQKIAEALHSGKFEFDSPAGHFQTSTSGENSLTGVIAQVAKGGGLVRIRPKQ